MQRREASLRKIRPLIPILTVQTPSSIVVVVRLAAKSTPIYRTRRPRQSPLYRTVERYLPEFERTYDRPVGTNYVADVFCQQRRWNCLDCSQSKSNEIRENPFWPFSRAKSALV